MKQKTPQEKKALSYAKDCRNTYGENDKGSRKSIRKHKTIQNQTLRRKANQVLSDVDTMDVVKVELVVELVKDKVKSIPKGNWKKCSDTPLGSFVEIQKDMRERRVGRKTRGILKKSNLDGNFWNKLKERS